MIFPMYIDGKWFEGEGRQMQDVISPGSGEVLGRIPLGTPEDADAALQAAKKAAPALAAMTVFERAEICYRIADKIDENQEELAKLLNISENQLSYITNVPAGHGIIRCGGAIIPFENSFPKNTKLYRLMTTKPDETF